MAVAMALAMSVVAMAMALVLAIAMALVLAMVMAMAMAVTMAVAMAMAVAVVVMAMAMAVVAMAVAVVAVAMANFKIFKPNQPRIGIIIGTGPSLSQEQISLAKSSGFPLFGCNNAFKLGIDVHLACNWQWWDTYWPEIKNYQCHKWTPRQESALKYLGINYIEERWEPGLSRDKSYICAHHGSGPQIVNMAYHYGCEIMLLIGWDMRYPGKISDREYLRPRHYFGEYPKNLQHWPRTGPNGELSGLIAEMETIRPADYGIDIINCTPGSAMTCFPFGDLGAILQGYE